jgi:hypothetical protein
MSYHAPPLLPVINLPVPRKKKDATYPRPADVYSSAPEKFDRNNPYHPTQLVNQHNLKELTRITLFKPPSRAKPLGVVDLGEPRQIK